MSERKCRREGLTDEWHLQLVSRTGMFEFNRTRLSQGNLSRLKTFIQVIIRKVEKIEMVSVMIDPRSVQES